MTDLADFLLARITEDEEVIQHALAAIDADRTEYAAQVARRTGQWSTVVSSGHCGVDMGPRGTIEATPGRALAECDAKRRIVRMWNYVHEFVPDGLVDKGEGRATLRYLALAYVDHQDYREEWRPRVS